MDLIALFVLVAAFGAAFFAFTALGLRRFINVEAARVVPVSQLSPGVVKVKGVCASMSEPVLSPISDRPCVWWGYELQKGHRRKNDGVRVWSTVRRGGAKAPFLLTDDTGTVAVCPVNARAVTYETRTLPADALPKMSIARLEELAAIGADTAVDDAKPGVDTVPDNEALSRHGKNFQIVESFLPVDATVWVYGTVRQRKLPAEGMEIVGTGKSPLLMSTGGQRRALANIVGARSSAPLTAFIFWGMGLYAFFNAGVVAAGLVLAVWPLVALAGYAAFRWYRVSRRAWH